MLKNQSDHPVKTGLDCLIEDDFAAIAGARVGAIVNQTSVDRGLHHLADVLLRTSKAKLAALFGPEHGVRGELQDMIGASSTVDRSTGVVVHSLYGSHYESLTPSGDMLEGLDALVFDIQDVGSRYYTFAATMRYAMIAAARRRIAFVVLDRPNPIDGTTIEGPTIAAGYSSFVGATSTPIRHGLTVGEIAKLIQIELDLDLNLTVIPCTGWSRSMRFEATGLPWVQPSPNMPTPATALVYPGGCLIEGTNLSEGRGTTRPFELWGAPWLDPERLARDANDLGLPGVRFRSATFRPMFHKHAGLVCGGAAPHVIDSRAFRPVETYTALIALARRCDPDRFAWRTEPYEFVADPIAIDLLYGSSRERTLIEQGVDHRVIAACWRDDEAEFAAKRKEILIYCD